MTERPECRVDTTERPEDATDHSAAGSASTDVLSEVLRAVRLRGAVFYSVNASAPWVAEAPPARELATYVMPGAEHVIEYHVLTSGSCWGGLIGEPAVHVEAGDIIIFPQGDAHVMSSAAGMRGPRDVEPYQLAAASRLPLRIDLGSGGRDPVHLVCGFLACDARPFNPLLTALPRVLHVKRARHDGGAGPAAAGSEMIHTFLNCALAEARSHRSGGEVVLARLSELMFVEAIRGFVESLETSQLGWLSGLRDELVGRALSAIHARPAHPWRLDELARHAGASRSVLAERFTAYVSVPPMQYLAQWRMQLASTLLAGPATLAQIADQVGYGSEAAFSRAFKKIVGVAPATWRATRAAASAKSRPGR